MKARTIVEYLLAVILVLILGGLAGWYFFLRTQTEATTEQNSARGYNVAIPEGNANGSVPGVAPTEQTSQTNSAPARGFLSRLWSVITGGGGAGTLSSISSSFSGQPALFSSGTDTTEEEAPRPASRPRPAQLWQVEAKPVAGQIFVGDDSRVRLRYVERASGYVFEADPETGEITRLTNTLMPKIYEALLTQNGHVYERSVDTEGVITTFAGTISTSTSASSSAQTLAGKYLTKNIESLATNPASGGLFYLVRDADGIAGLTADWNGEKQKTLLSSAILHWRPTILADGRIILTQAAADTVPGYSYELKKDGVLSPFLGPVLGLTLRARAAPGANAPSAVLWGQSTRGVMTLSVQISQSATAVQLPIRTLADKCAWAPDLHRESTSDSKSQSPLGAPGTSLIAYCGVPQGSTGQNFLDDWYRGAVHSSDALWRIDASAGTAEALYTPPSNTPIDIKNMVVDSAGEYIAFTNAVDTSLWLFRLTK